jgi:hypothetical protein
MLKQYGNMLLSLFMALLLITAVATAGETPRNDAIVTMLQGKATVFADGVSAGRLLKKGDTLKKHDVIKVGSKSRLEIRFPDGTVMRLAEKSSLKLNDVWYNKQTEGKKFMVNLAIGRLWAKVKKLATPDSAVVVETSNAVAGVRGTTYRVNVEEDSSAMVKVYDGTVYVANPPKEAASKPAVQVAKPAEVPGPREVPPPYREVSMEEWTVIVKAMQQVSISPKGIPSQAESFDAQADADDWVKWNQERDQATTL